MRAMPSPTSSTRPTSRASSWPRYCSISACNTETISSALNLMTASLYELIPNRIKPGSNRGVVEPIADPHDDTAQEVWIDFRLQHGLEFQVRTQLLHQAVGLSVGQGHGRAHLYPSSMGAHVSQHLGRRQD